MPEFTFRAPRSSAVDVEQALGLNRGDIEAVVRGVDDTGAFCRVVIKAGVTLSGAQRTTLSAEVAKEVPGAVEA